MIYSTNIIAHIIYVWAFSYVLLYYYCGCGSRNMLNNQFSNTNEVVPEITLFLDTYK